MVPREPFKLFWVFFFLFRIRYSICDFKFLFSPHNSICYVGLNISGWYLKAFPAWLNTRPKILFPVYCIIYINIYSTIYCRWPDVDAWYLEKYSAVTAMWTISNQINSVKLCSCLDLRTLWNMFLPLKKDQMGNWQ